MYYFDDKQHHTPHIHVRYQGEEAILSIPDGDILAGKLQRSRLRLVLAWTEIHKDELMANWDLAVEGQQVSKIDPLK